MKNDKDMKQDYRKMRYGLMLLLMLPATLCAYAQSRLNVDKVFQQFGHSKGCKMVEMHDVVLEGYQLKVYKSLVYSQNASAITPYLLSDRKEARKIKEVVEDGRIVSGYYMMAPLSKGINRYVLFSRPKEKRGVVIYIEGTLSPDNVMKLCYNKKVTK